MNHSRHSQYTQSILYCIMIHRHKCIIRFERCYSTMMFKIWHSVHFMCDDCQWRCQCRELWVFFGKPTLSQLSISRDVCLCYGINQQNAKSSMYLMLVFNFQCWQLVLVIPCEIVGKTGCHRCISHICAHILTW